ncbi:putative bifunctional diguanylate cyclase/phosphodiesterase [Huintestinicola sp.]|uniref:putative bifunctional diguanylate cyclase/phosphodiesterase n=1 Tax=Huintestinicola sp. TaxID=2981661 RepID=UPI003D7EBC26
MENCNFCGGVLKFFEKINENVDNIDNAMDNITIAAEAAAEGIRLGRVTLSLIAPPSELEPEGVNKYGEFFLSPEGYEENGVEKHFTTKEGGSVCISFMPAKGEKWNDSEKSMIGMLIKNCYIISVRARVMGLMEKSMYLDRMTGVCNTEGFMRYGGMLMAQGKLVDYAAAFINIKNFKYANQLFGNRQGDALLRKFAQAMDSFVKDDGKFARLGGDNFIVIIKKGRITDLRGFVDALSFEMGEGEARQLYDIRLRMGIYEAVEGDTMSDIMNKSSIAFNAARSDERRDVVFYSPLHLEAAIHKKEISTLFPKALENREFVVYYQPKVRLSDNKLCGCEALCRWVRDGKVVPPMDFIPILETEGTICRLDFYVFEAVCADIKRWLEMGIEPVRVSVNFSKRHLHNKRLADQILGIIRKYEIDGKYVEVELTEMTGAEDLTAMSVFVERMKENGVGTSIDDFGTGYSSLNLLKDLDVDVIKLDKSFFTNINESDGGISTDRIVVKNIVNMVNELNMEAISEGVETHAQAEFLRETHCSMAQGFLFDRPLPKDEFEKRLSDGSFYADKG